MKDQDLIYTPYKSSHTTGTMIQVSEQSGRTVNVRAADQLLNSPAQELPGANMRVGTSCEFNELAEPDALASAGQDRLKNDGASGVTLALDACGVQDVDITQAPECATTFWDEATAVGFQEEHMMVSLGALPSNVGGGEALARRLYASDNGTSQPDESTDDEFPDENQDPSEPEPRVNSSRLPLQLPPSARILTESRRHGPLYWSPARLGVQSPAAGKRTASVLGNFGSQGREIKVPKVNSISENAPLQAVQIKVQRTAVDYEAPSPARKAGLAPVPEGTCLLTAASRPLLAERTNTPQKAPRKRSLLDKFSSVSESGAPVNDSQDKPALQDTTPRRALQLLK